MPATKNRASGIGQLLGKRVREFRLARHMTQGQLAERVGVETETISRLERGTALPSLLKIQELAVALEVSLTELVGGSSTLPNDQARQMEKLLEGLSEADRGFILSIAKAQKEYLLSRQLVVERRPSKPG